MGRVFEQLKIPVAIILGLAAFGFIVRDRLPTPDGGSSRVPVETDSRVEESSNDRPVEAAVPESTRVTFVVDGDTVELDNGERVRLIGIDTPERGKPFYGQARDALAAIVLNKAVRLERDVSERDRYGRLLAYVYVGEEFVNLSLVEKGMAKAYTYPPDVGHAADFVAAEREAREAGRGLWAGDSPTSSSQTSSVAESRADAYDIPACAATDCDCADFTSHAEAQWFHDYHNEAAVHRLDRDKDGRVCETLP